VPLGNLFAIMALLLIHVSLIQQGLETQVNALGKNVPPLAKIGKLINP